MDSGKTPVLLTVLVETSKLRWYVAGAGLDGTAIPLISSQPGNLAPYLGVPPDDQLSFLRHRFSGVLQRGCDRLWGRQMKPCQIVFIADGAFAQADPQLFRNLGEHLAAWMTKPPVVAFASRNGFQPPGPATLDLVAGAIDPIFQQALAASLPQLFAATARHELWELAPK
jgi:hypothetical protein